MSVLLGTALGAVLLVLLRSRDLPSGPVRTSEQFYSTFADLDYDGMRDMICSEGFGVEGRVDLVTELMSDASDLGTDAEIDLEDFRADEQSNDDGVARVRVRAHLRTDSGDLEIDEVLLLQRQYGYDVEWCVVDSLTRGSWQPYEQQLAGLRLHFVPSTAPLAPNAANTLSLVAEDTMLVFSDRYPVELRLADARGVSGFHFRVTYDDSLLTPAGGIDNELYDELDLNALCTTSYHDGEAVFDCARLAASPCDSGPVAASVGGINFAAKRLGSASIQLVDVTLTVDPARCATPAATAVDAGALKLSVQWAPEP